MGWGDWLSWGKESKPQGIEQYFTNEHIKYVAEEYNIPVLDDPDEGDWMKNGAEWKDSTSDPHTRKRTVEAIRRLAKLQPNVKSSLRYYQSFILGRDFWMGVKPLDPKQRPTESQKKEMLRARRAWLEFTQENYKQWNAKEMVRRSLRDGDEFTRKFSTREWPPKVRFMDPEEIWDASDPQTDGIITVSGDAATPLLYRQIDLATGSQMNDIPAEDVFHAKIDCDVNEKRGNSRYLPVVRWVRKFWALLEIELKHRMLQSSIVMQRKIRGGQASVRRHLDHSSIPANDSLATGDSRREKMLGGSIINTSEGVEIEFKQPTGNFSDASPLAKLLLMQVSVSTGFPYYLISGDAGDSNFSGNLIQESPIALMIDDERGFFGHELELIYRWVLEEAAKSGKVSEALWDDFEVDVGWPSIVTRDTLKEAQANNIYRMGNAISAREFSRRSGADPDQMRQEIEEEMDAMLMGPQGDVTAMNQSNQQKSANQGANGATGTNQGGGKPIQHKDNQTGAAA